MIQWRQLVLNCTIDDNGDLFTTMAPQLRHEWRQCSANGDMNAVPMTSIATMVPKYFMVPLTSLGPIGDRVAVVMKFRNIVAIDVIGARGAISTNGSPSSLFAPLLPLAPLLHELVPLLIVANKSPLCPLSSTLPLDHHQLTPLDRQMIHSL